MVHAMARKEAILEVKIQGSLKEMAEKIRGCRKHPEFRTPKDEIFRKKDKRTLNKSIAKGHLHPLEFITFSCRSYIPRLWTLMLASSSYISMLQESTRSVEHDDYYFPQALHNHPDIIKEIEQEFIKSFELYKKAINKGMAMQDAMYCLPLYTLTGDSFNIKLKELYHLKLVYPKIIKEMYEWCMEKLELHTRLEQGLDFNFKTWLEQQEPVNDLTNYSPCLVVVSDEEPNVYEKFFNIVKSQNNTQVINISNPFKSEKTDFISQRLDDPLFAGILYSRTSLRLDFSCDLSVLHELLRHRSLQKNLLPITMKKGFSYFNHRW